MSKVFEKEVRVLQFTYSSLHLYYPRTEQVYAVTSLIINDGKQVVSVNCEDVIIESVLNALLLKDHKQPWSVCLLNRIHLAKDRRKKSNKYFLENISD